MASSALAHLNLGQRQFFLLLRELAEKNYALIGVVESPTRRTRGASWSSPSSRVTDVGRAGHRHAS